MDLSQVTADMKRQASMYALEMNIPKGELEFRFNNYWSEVKDVLHPNLVKAAQKGGFREVRRDRVVKAAGGPSEFYKPILAEVVQEYLESQERQALTFNNVEMKEGLTQYTINAAVYLEPEVVWKKAPGLEAPLTVKLPKQPEGLIERMVDSEIATARENATILVPIKEDAVAELGQVVTLDAESVMDGEKWAPGSFTNNKWLLKRELFHIPEMMEALLGMKAGESKKITAVLNERFTENVRGKSVDITLRVGQVYNRETPAIDDDLAKTYGFDTLEAYKANLTLKATQELTTGRDQLIMQDIISQLLNPETVEIEPIPFVWMANKAREIYGQSRTMVRTEEELITHFKGQTLMDGRPVVDKSSLLTFLGEKIAQQLVHDLVLRSWGKKKGVEGNRSLETLPEYVTAVKKALLADLKIEEYSVQEYVEQKAAEAEKVQP